MAGTLRKYLKAGNIALLVSIISLVFTIWFNLSREAQLNREELLVKCRPVGTDYFVHPVMIDSSIILIPVKYECTISNNGLRNASIIDYRIIRDTEEAWYNDYQVYADKKMPVNITPGNSTVISIEILKELKYKDFNFETINDSFLLSDLLNQAGAGKKNVLLMNNLTEDISGISVITAKGSIFRSI